MAPYTSRCDGCERLNNLQDVEVQVALHLLEQLGIALGMPDMVADIGFLLAALFCFLLCLEDVVVQFPAAC